MSLFLQKTPEADIKKYVLPLIYGAIMNENLKIQELCLSIIPNIGRLVERDQMKTQLLPKLLKLALEGSVVSVSYIFYLHARVIGLKALIPKLGELTTF